MSTKIGANTPFPNHQCSESCVQEVVAVDVRIRPHMAKYSSSLRVLIADDERLIRWSLLGDCGDPEVVDWNADCVRHFGGGRSCRRNGGVRNPRERCHYWLSRLF
jgi:hypothetical protein